MSKVNAGGETRVSVKGGANPGHQALIGTWAAATWTIRFYERHGFAVTTPEEKNRLLKTYWTIPERQVETSVVLVQRKLPHAS
jgi:hypothetical protein